MTLIESLALLSRADRIMRLESLLRHYADQEDTERGDNIRRAVGRSIINLLQTAPENGWPIPCLICGTLLKEGERFQCAACESAS